MAKVSGYFPISPLEIFPGSEARFRVFLKRGEDNFLLYCAEEEPFGQDKRQRLHDLGVTEVFIPEEDAKVFRTYREEHLAQLLGSSEIPLETRSRIFYSSSNDIAKDVFGAVLPTELPREHLDRVNHLVEDCLAFLSKESSLAEIAKLMSHDYETYSHCVNVFVLTISLLRLFDCEEAELKDVGVGAVLHDIGKNQVPREILRKPGRLTKEEFEVVKRHPTQGAALCMNLELSAKSSNVVLYHHEKLDGSGYPAGVGQSQIPLYIRAVTIADIYDALTSKRPYSEPRAPFDALNLMSQEFKDQIDMGVFERFVKMLSGLNL